MPKKKAVPPDAYLARINPDGKIAWMKSWGDKRDDVAKGIAINGDLGPYTEFFADRPYPMGDAKPYGGAIKPANRGIARKLLDTGTPLVSGPNHPQV